MGGPDLGMRPVTVAPFILLLLSGGTRGASPGVRTAYVTQMLLDTLIKHTE